LEEVIVVVVAVVGGVEEDDVDVEEEIEEEDKGKGGEDILSLKQDKRTTIAKVDTLISLFPLSNCIIKSAFPILV